MDTLPLQEGAHRVDSVAHRLRANAQSRLFPFMLQQRCLDLFSYSSSSFVVQRSKAGTARVVCWQDLGIANRYGCSLAQAQLVHRPGRGDTVEVIYLPLMCKDDLF